MSDPKHVILRYELGRHGWSDLQIEIDAQKFSLQITHAFNDPIEELIDFIANIHEEKFPAFAVLQDEPGAHALRLEVDGERGPTLRLLASQENFPRESQFEEIAAFSVDPSLVALQLYADLVRIEILMENMIYREGRTQIPWRAFRELKRKFRRAQSE